MANERMRWKPAVEKHVGNTNTETNRWFLFWRKFRQTSKNQQLGETKGEKESADGNAEKSYENWVATKAWISLALLRRCKKTIDDVQYLYKAKEN